MVTPALEQDEVEVSPGVLCDVSAVIKIQYIDYSVPVTMPHLVS